MKAVNAYLNNLLGTNADYIITGDTDSIYINFGVFVERFFPNKTDEEITELLLKSVIPKLQKVIDKAIEGVFVNSNAVQRTISYKAEAIASKGFFTAKKRYALKVHNSEGVYYNPPKIKAMGLDLVKTSTPAVIRKMLKDSLSVIFDTDETATQKYIQECYEKFTTLTPEQIAFPRGVSDIEKWIDGNGQFMSGMPIHCRAAAVYNSAIKSFGDKHSAISNGDKLRFIYLKMPNKLNQNVIACPADSVFPVELELDKFYDYELQFEKVFMKPMRGLVNSIGWDEVEKSSLEDFFG